MKLKFTLLILIISLQSFGQAKTSPMTMEFGLGLGMNYGLIGTKTVIGYNNTGILIGLGIFPGALFDIENALGYEIGFQVSKKWFYANVGYGVFGVHVNGTKVTPITAGDVMIGAKINMGAAKRTFLDIGIGHTFGADPLSFYGTKIDQNGVNGVLGIGWRFTKKNKPRDNLMPVPAMQ